MSQEPNWLEFFEDRERLYSTYFLDFAEQNARRAPEAYEHLEAESGNLLKTAAWLAEQSEAEGILKLAMALWEKSDFLRSRGFMQRGLPLLEQAHQAARQIGDLEAEFTWLEASANVHHENGNPKLAQQLFEEALELAQSLDNLHFKAKAHLGIGRVLMEKGQLNRGAYWLKQALQDYRDIKDSRGEISILTALGELLSLEGDFSGAKTYLSHGLQLSRMQPTRREEMLVHYSLGYSDALADDWQQAIAHFEHVTDIAKAIGDRFFEIRGLHNIGEAWLALGNVQQAVVILEEALDRQEIIDDVLTKAFTHFYLAKAYHVLNELDKSLIQLRYVYPLGQVPVLAAEATEAAWIEADIHLKQKSFELARIALFDVLNLAPEHMADIRHKAEILLKTIESEEEVWPGIDIERP